jgi:hypothetical protein
MLYFFLHIRVPVSRDNSFDNLHLSHSKIIKGRVN